MKNTDELENAMFYRLFFICCFIVSACARMHHPAHSQHFNGGRCAACKCDNILMRGIVLPKSIRIGTSTRHSENNYTTSDIIGPYEEGSHLNLFCEADGGLPTPSLTWWRGSTLVDDSYSISSRGSVINVFHIPKLQREDLLTQLTCQAANTNLTTPLSITVTIDLILPPKNLTIGDGKNVYTTSGIIGPYEEGATVSLVCETFGGRPTPSLSWWRGSTLIDDSYTLDSGGFSQNSLVLLNLERKDLLTQFTCQAAYTNRTAPLSIMVTIDLILPPQEVLITTPWQSLSAGDELEVVCQTYGSRPPAGLSWWVGEKSLKANVKEEVSADGNSTSSRLIFRPTSEEDGKTLICRAHNPETPDSDLEDSWN